MKPWDNKGGSDVDDAGSPSRRRCRRWRTLRELIIQSPHPQPERDSQQRSNRIDVAFGAQVNGPESCQAANLDTLAHGHHSPTRQHAASQRSNQRRKRGDAETAGHRQDRQIARTAFHRTGLIIHSRRSLPRRGKSDAAHGRRGRGRREGHPARCGDYCSLQGDGAKRPASRSVRCGAEEIFWFEMWNSLP